MPISIFEQRTSIASTTIFLLYLLLLGLIYEITYWKVFGINIFEYDSIYSIAINAISPLSVLFLILLASTGINTYLMPSRPSTEKLHEHEKFSNRNIRTIHYLFYLVMLIFLTIWVGAGGTYLIYYPLTFLLVIPFLTVLSNQSFLSRQIPNNKLRYFITLIFLTFPIFSSFFGYLTASQILNNKGYQYLVEITSEKGMISTNSPNFKYLGKGRDYALFISLDNSEYKFINTDNAASFELKKFEEPKKSFFESYL